MPIVTLQNYLDVPVLVSLRGAAHNKHYFGIRYWPAAEHISRTGRLAWRTSRPSGQVMEHLSSQWRKGYYLSMGPLRSRGIWKEIRKGYPGSLLTTGRTSGYMFNGHQDSELIPFRITTPLFR